MSVSTAYERVKHQTSSPHCSRGYGVCNHPGMRLSNSVETAVERSSAAERWELSGTSRHSRTLILSRDFERDEVAVAGKTGKTWKRKV